MGLSRFARTRGALPVSQWLRGGGGSPSRILRGTITISNGSLTGTDTVASVDVVNTLVIHLGETHGAAEPNNSRRRSRVTLTNATTVTATRGDTTGTQTVAYELREYRPGAIRSIQRDTSADGTKAISSVNTAKATIDCLGWSTTQADGDCGARVTLTNATTVTVTAQGTATTAGFQVTEWN